MKRVTIFIDGSANDRESLASALAFCRCLDGQLSVVHPRPPDDVVASPDGQSVVLVKNEAALSSILPHAGTQVRWHVGRDLARAQEAPTGQEQAPAQENGHRIRQPRATQTQGRRSVDGVELQPPVLLLDPLHRASDGRHPRGDMHPLEGRPRSAGASHRHPPR